jgi:hypothetical protein
VLFSVFVGPHYLAAEGRGLVVIGAAALVEHGVPS